MRKVKVDDMHEWKKGNGKTQFSFSSGEYSSDDKYIFNMEKEAKEFMETNEEFKDLISQLSTAKLY